MKKVLTITFVLFAHALLFAGGFQTGTQGARAMGMGHAFVGLASDPSAIYFNAAGLTSLRGINFMAGTTLIMPKVDFTGPKPLTTVSSTVSRTFTPINIYGTYSMEDGLSFGLGIFNPFGLGSEWPANWIGRQLSVKSELRTFYINPTVAYKVTDLLSVGAGFNYIISNVQFYRIVDIPPIANNVGINLEGNGKAAHTFNLGILFKPFDYLSFGIAYRHSAKIDFEGDLKFSDLPATHSTSFPEGKWKASITMPYDLRAGISTNPMDKLTVNADLQYVGWSSYKELAVDFENNTAVWTDQVQKRDWKNSFTLRIGGEYDYNPFAFRLGYVYDGSPIPTKYMDPSLPGANRHEFTVGLGYKLMKNLTLDVAYQFISFTQEVNDSDFNFNGEYKNSSNLVGFNLSYGF